MAKSKTPEGWTYEAVDKDFGFNMCEGVYEARMRIRFFRDK